jgi:hypothetical protein
MTLKQLTDLLIEMPTLCTVEDVAREARRPVPDVIAAAHDGASLGWIVVNVMQTAERNPPRLISLTPLGAERAGVVLIDVRIRRGDDWTEEPRWMPVEAAWWLLQDARRLGYPVIDEDADLDRQVHRDAHEWTRSVAWPPRVSTAPARPAGGRWPTRSATATGATPTGRMPGSPR